MSDRQHFANCGASKGDLKLMWLSESNDPAHKHTEALHLTSHRDGPSGVPRRVVLRERRSLSEETTTQLRQRPSDISTVAMPVTMTILERIEAAHPNDIAQRPVIHELQTPRINRSRR